MGQTWQASKCRRVAINGSLSSGAREDPSRGGDSSGYVYHRPGRHDDSLPTALQILGEGWEDVVHSWSREGVGVPDGLFLVVGEVGH